MTPTQVSATRDHLNRMFPRSRWTEDEMAAFEQSIDPLSIDDRQAAAVINEYKRCDDKVSTTPNFARLVQKLRAVAVDRATDKGTASGLTQDLEFLRDSLGMRSNDQALEELVARWRATQSGDPDGFAHWMPRWFLDTVYWAKRPWAIRFLAWAQGETECSA